MYQTLSIKEFKSNYIINISKIIIILLFSLVVIANFVPFYEATHDSYVYALKAQSLLEGTWEISNQKLTETGKWEFVPNSWKKTIDDTAIPKYPPGLPIIGSVAYLFAGINGLFFLGPILGIIFIIISDRVATNLFGKEVGLLTILFLVTNGIIFVGSIHLLSDNIFATLIILGFFYLIKFFKHNNYSYLILASIILSFSSFIRISGIIYLPIEIILIISFIVYSQYKKTNNTHIKNNKKQKILKTIFGITVPWLIFILFFISFNNYYFGDPLTTFYNIPDDPWIKPGTNSYLSIFEIKSDNFEIIKSYSNFVLPYPLYKIEILDFEKISQERDDPVTTTLVNFTSDLIGKNTLGLMTIFIVISAILLSFFKINKKISILIFSFIIFSNILFWSSGHISFGRDSVLGRYMIPAFPFFSIIISYLIVCWLKIDLTKMKIKTRTIIKISKILIMIGLILFFGIAMYNSPIGQWGDKDNFQISDPFSLGEYYPLDLEGLEKNSIIIGGHSAKMIDYGFSTFDPFSGTPIQRTTVFDPKSLDPIILEKLRNILEKENNVFIYKELLNKNDKIFREFLVSEQNYSIIEYSESFCKVEINNKNQSNTTYDQICLGLN